MDIMSKIGRPTAYTPELIKEICDTIASSNKGTKRLCAENPHWPSQDTLFTWLKNYPEFSEQYIQAKRCQADVLVDEILEIADDDSRDNLVNELDGRTIANQIAVSRDTLKINTRKWIASKLVPRVYGNCKVDNTQPVMRHEDYLKFLE